MISRIAACTVIALGVTVAVLAADPPATKPAVMEAPEWLFPIDPNSIHPPKDPPKLDDTKLLTLANSKESFTAARIGDSFNPTDWHPADHGPMPDVVAKGRKPDVLACAFCHTPTGQGRPENAPIAGLPEGYFRQQLIDMRSGARKPVGPVAYKPNQVMHKIAHAMTDAEIDESAKYFAQQKLRRHVWVIESLRIPRAEPAAWIYVEVGGTEDLEDRLLEVTNELERHERRDDRLEYTAYVPPGSLMRGKRMVMTGDGKTQACAQCHGKDFKGLNDVPPLAGRSPSYLLRQLVAFRTRARQTQEGMPMQPVVDGLDLRDMIAAAAYAGSLPP